MEIKLFGKSLFEAKKSKIDQVMGLATQAVQESKYLPDFHGGWNNNGGVIWEIAQQPIATKIEDASKKKKVEKEKIKLTPKGVFELKLLNNESFKLNTNSEYIENQLSNFKDKLGMIKAEEYDMRRGVEEIGSIVVRLENRKKYPEVKDFFEEFPYTSTSKIDGMLKLHDHLKLGKIAQFIADMPKEAVEVMKKYNENTEKVCKKKAVFYIIADKKDFEVSNKRRDPILLAQSPFGHFWQILGAWDEEMMFLEEL